MKNENQKSKNASLVLFAIVMPVGLVLLLAVIFVGPMFGFDLIDKSKSVASNIPIVDSLIEEDEPSEESTETPNDLKAENDSLTIELEQTKAQLEEVDLALGNARSELNALQEEQTRNEQQEATTQPEPSSTTSELAKTYEAMSAKSAAAILDELTVEEILVQLEGVKTETRSLILEKMNTEKAADVVREWSNEQ